VPSAGLNESGHPLFCPILHEPDIIAVGQSQRDCEYQIARVQSQLNEWLILIRAAAGKNQGSKRKE
jgi:hypothetical protein